MMLSKLHINNHPGMRDFNVFGEDIELHDEIVMKFENAIGRGATDRDIEKIIKYCDSEYGGFDLCGVENVMLDVAYTVPEEYER